MNTDKKDLGAFLPGFLTKISVHPRLFVVNFDLRNTLLGLKMAKGDETNDMKWSYWERPLAITENGVKHSYYKPAIFFEEMTDDLNKYAKQLEALYKSVADIKTN